MPIRTRRAAVTGSACAACLFWAAAAAAQDAVAIHLAYDVPARCPTEGQFLDMVTRDGGHVAVVADETPARSFAVHVEGKDTLVGRLVVREDDGTDAVREIAVASCEDVARSLAVLVALAAQPLPPASDATPPTAAAPEAPDPAPSSGLGAPPTPAEVTPEPAENTAPAPTPRPRVRRFDVSGEATLDKGIGQAANPGLAAYVERVDDAASFFAPTFRVGVQLPLNEGATSSAAPGTTYRRLVGRLDGCPVHIMLSRPWADDAFTLTACARLDVGRLEAEAYGFGGNVEIHRPWVATAGLARLRWTSPRYFVELEAGVAFPLVREDFGGGDVVPAAPATGGLGFGGFFL